MSSSHSSSFKPASPTSIIVSPLQIRKNKNAIMDSPTTPSDISPVTPATRTAPSRALAPPVPSSRFSSSTHGSQQDQSSKPPARKSTNVPAIVDPSEFSGLEVDTRKPLPQVPPPGYEMREYSTPYGAQMAHEKDMHFHQYPPSHPALGVAHPAFQPQPHGISRATTSGTLGSMNSRDIEIDNKHLVNERFDQEQAAKAKPQGLFQRRKRLWILVGVILLLIIIGAIVGGVVGSRKRAQAETAPSTSVAPSLTSAAPIITPTAAPDVYDNQLPPGAVHANSPLAAIQFTTNSSEKNAQAGTQNYELYYNNRCGNTAQLQNTGSWRDPNGIIFTDAINGSGMAAMTNWNATRSMHETTVFYIGNDNTLRDKRLTAETNTFDVGPLIRQKITVPAAPSDATTQSNLTRSLTSYSLAAAFSASFPSGPGARLFYHAQNNSQTYLQELIYTLSTDTWAFGTTIPGALPTSHLSLIADEPNAVARLMFASAAPNADATASPPALQEYYLPLNRPSASWTKGQSFPDLLLHPWSQFSLAAAAGTAFLYHVAPVNDSSPALRIREVALPNANSTDPIRAQTAETVAVPDWLSEDTGGRVATAFAPVSAVAGAGYVNVFFGHGVVDAEAGYGRLSFVSRKNGDGWGVGGGGSAVNDLMLNTKCAKPDV